jgi:hypothetical protein
LKLAHATQLAPFDYAHGAQTVLLVSFHPAASFKTLTFSQNVLRPFEIPLYNYLYRNEGKKNPHDG